MKLVHLLHILAFTVGAWSLLNLSKPQFFHLENGGDTNSAHFLGLLLELNGIMHVKRVAPYLGDSINISFHDDSPSGSPVHSTHLNLNRYDTLSLYHSLSQIPSAVYEMGYEIKPKLNLEFWAHYILCLQAMLQLYLSFLPHPSIPGKHPLFLSTLYASHRYTFAHAVLTPFPAH